VVSTPSNMSFGATACFADHTIFQPITPCRRRSREQEQLRCALTLVHAATLEAELGIGTAQQRSN
jgi:hypothetical protein